MGTSFRLFVVVSFRFVVFFSSYLLFSLFFLFYRRKIDTHIDARDDFLGVGVNVDDNDILTVNNFMGQPSNES